LRGCRKFFFYWLTRIINKYLTLCGGVFPQYVNVDFDYTPYLGPDYMEEIKTMKRVSTIVSNHSSWCDSLTLLSSSYSPGFAAKKSLRKAPIVGIACVCLNCIFISRGATEDKRQKIIQ
jgi:1-acyl-sn-glycerol-3-phosphate acyltransferase